MPRHYDPDCVDFEIERICTFTIMIIISHHLLVNAVTDSSRIITRLLTSASLPSQSLFLQLI